MLIHHWLDQSKAPCGTGTSIVFNNLRQVNGLSGTNYGPKKDEHKEKKIILTIVEPTGASEFKQNKLFFSIYRSDCHLL
jgi:hypothetical protein